MEKIVLIGGKAGLGAARTSILLGKIFTRMGYYVFNYRDYPSLIRGGHNFNVLKISTKPVFSLTSSICVLLFTFTAPILFSFLFPSILFNVIPNIGIFASPPLKT